MNRKLHLTIRNNKSLQMKQVAHNSFLKRLIFILSLVILSGLSQNSLAQEVITIQQAIDKTLTNNLQVKQSKLSESLSDETLQQSKLAIYPSLNANVGQNMNWGRNQSQSGLFENTQRYSACLLYTSRCV